MKKNKINVSIKDLENDFPDKKSYFQYIFNIKKDSYENICPKCNKSMDKFYFIEKRNLFACSCGYQMHPTVNTVFEKSKTPIELWFYTIYLISIYGEELTIKDIQREINVTYKTAWKMMTEIKKIIQKEENNS